MNLFQPASEFLPMIGEVCIYFRNLGCYYVIWLDFSQSCTWQVYEKLGESVKDIVGARMEDNKFCVSVHYRNVAEDVIMLYPSVCISLRICFT